MATKTKSKTKIKLFGDRIFVRPIAFQSNANGIVLPDSVHKSALHRGEVVSVGTGRITEAGSRVEPLVAVGDVVLFDSFSGFETEVDGEKLKLFRETDLLGVEV